MRIIEGGGVTAPSGYRAAGIQTGVKESGAKDLALVYSTRPANAAAVYTTNKVQGAPIAIDREHLADGKARAVILNSGNANVCNGDVGLDHARRMCALTASELGLQTEEVLVCSTGLIGVPLPIAKIEAGIPRIVAALSEDGGATAAEAIMTTDTVPKSCAVEVELESGRAVVGAMAKGAAMIAPNMATMLSVVTTDATVPSGPLQELLSQAIQRTFNCITVDGDMSTSDTVILMANGDGSELGEGDCERLYEGIEYACRQMAQAIARDAEGSSKLITIAVRGAATEAEARQVGIAVANSSLVKTAAFGNDPNWGRILCAMGYAGVEFDPERVRVSLCGTDIYGNGAGLDFDEDRLSAAMQAEEMAIGIDLAMGQATAEIFTCDLTYEYVRLNAEYTT
ncbi:MAG: bifunctional glutamate N-acetyltransferase/amino-acid acetyltransferase ArgJ [Gemmatimonadetes bacterium]|nr:bifunctional glutamate N-acetyltransferase/amino-acid acetyltransferase ArgJ [Gemmatimonadota bacterium]MYI62424.1 bifunctional glutamate N-acetyltransferase/amino-acid acetyltransferase ArgJ [Gemmatimonadota bacterium]